ncbi:MAG: ABC transporter substrate-binding protein [Treponema sp.]|jgi:peptide/nickel transport system substrate-binding protein|nr:ABC transporter substrate-binding protein [Treponema sp.]
MRTLCAASVLAALLAASCGGVKDKEPDQLTIAVPSEPSNFDLLYSASMLEGQIGNNIYDNLLAFDEQGSASPYLAEACEASPDGLTYTFRLRKGVRFHNGEELKASDLAFTVEYGKNTPNGSRLCGAVAAMELIDGYTLRLTLKEPMASFLAEFAGDQFAVYNEKAVRSAGTYGAEPVGTGAYRYAGRDAGAELRLEAFEDHFRGPPPIKRLRYRVIADDFSAAAALQSGEVDLIWSLGAAAAANLEGQADIAVRADPSNRVNYLTMNVERPPFDQPKLRQAVNYALNREAIRDAVYEGRPVERDAMPFPWMIGFAGPALRYGYDPQRAEALAREAGISPEAPARLSLLVTAATSRIGELVQQDMAAIGIGLSLETLEFNAWIDRYYRGEFSMAVGGYFMTIADMNMLATFYSSQAIGAGNSARYRSAEADRLFALGRRETDPLRRAAIYQRLADRVQEDAPYAVFANPPIIRAAHKALRIGRSGPNGILMRDVSWE